MQPFRLSQFERVFKSPKPGKNPIVLIDYGCKKAIIDNLKDLGFPLVIVGHKTKASEILDFKPRMIFLSMDLEIQDPTRLKLKSQKTTHFSNSNKRNLPWSPINYSSSRSIHNKTTIWREVLTILVSSMRLVKLS